MVDLPMMARLLGSIVPACTRMIIVGDADQLPAVQAGSVLGDIAEAARTTDGNTALRESFVRLMHNWRSGESPHLSGFIGALQSGDDQAALNLLGKDGLHIAEVPGMGKIEDFVADTVVPAFLPIREMRDPAQALAQFDRFRLICALRRGPYGADAINTIARSQMRPGGGHYHGMPIIVTRNDPASGLSNGDAGLILDDGARRWAWFPGAEGPRPVALQRLPAHEVAYALTVHRSQGSEFETVAILFPPEDHPLLTREMVYTAASRARRHMTLHSSSELLAAALARRAQRASGLAAKLA